jgi:hypothetical protein
VLKMKFQLQLQTKSFQTVNILHGTIQLLKLSKWSAKPEHIKDLKFPFDEQINILYDRNVKTQTQRQLIYNSSENKIILKMIVYKQWIVFITSIIQILSYLNPITALFNLQSRPTIIGENKLYEPSPMPIINEDKDSCICN